MPGRHNNNPDFDPDKDTPPGLEESPWRALTAAVSNSNKQNERIYQAVLAMGEKAEKAQQATQDKLNQFALALNSLEHRTGPLANLSSDAPLMLNKLGTLETKVGDLEKEGVRRDAELKALQLESAGRAGQNRVIYAILGVFSAFLITGVVWLIQLSGRLP